MKREIKFRGQSTKDGEWNYGDYRNIAGYNFIDDKPIHSPSLGQYTGLKDKNGKEIYEGDIMQSEEFGHIGEVVWNEVIAGFKLKFSAAFSAHIADRNDYMEVVGNIHENPELLS